MDKAAIIIDPLLPIGILANAVACITSGLFLDGDELVGPEISGKDVNYIPITKIPILILKPGNKDFKEIIMQAQQSKLKYVAFTKEAQSTTDYISYQNRVEGKLLDEVTVIGVGIVGHKTIINSLTGSMPMLR